MHQSRFGDKSTYCAVEEYENNMKLLLIYDIAQVGSRGMRMGSGVGYCCPWSHRLRPKKLYASVAVPPATVWVPI